MSAQSHTCASLLCFFQRPSLIIIRYWQKISDPLVGPKGVRTLLVFRGLTGCESLWQYACSLANAPSPRRFFGLSGVYFSLQYLSLSDATVLTFMVPILTGFSGAVFLKEPLSLRELLAGCMHATCSLLSRFTPEDSMQLSWGHINRAAAVSVR